MGSHAEHGNQSKINPLLSLGHLTQPAEVEPFRSLEKLKRISPRIKRKTQRKSFLYLSSLRGTKQSRDAVCVVKRLLRASQ